MANAVIDSKFKSEVGKTLAGVSIRYCQQCGKCVAVCSAKRLGEEYSPIKVLRATLLGLKDMVLYTDIIWRCLSCKACTDICPAGVKFQDFIEAVRRIAIEEGITEHVVLCKHCGKSFTTIPTQKLVEKLLPQKIQLDEERLMLCPQCRSNNIAQKLAPFLTHLVG
jgi:heterodisulfide reductase subunit C